MSEKGIEVLEKNGPVVITDAADNVGGGTPGDTPAVLRELLANQGILDDGIGLILVHYPDPTAIQQVRDRSMTPCQHANTGLIACCHRVQHSHAIDCVPHDAVTFCST